MATNGIDKSAPTSDPMSPPMAVPMPAPAMRARNVSAGWISTDSPMIFGETNVYTTCWMMTVPTNAIMPMSGLSTTLVTKARPPPSHGPMMGMMLRSPVMTPSAAGEGTPRTANMMPQPKPIMPHWMSIALR